MNFSHGKGSSLPWLFFTSSMRSSLLILITLIPFCVHSQSKWRNYVGAYFTGDASMYYTGPSILIGSDLHINENISAGFYAHYFMKDLGDHSFLTWTVAALGQINIGKRKKFYMAVGPAWQRTIEEDDLYPDEAINRSIIVPAYRLGRHFVFKKFVISPEINLTGPYIDRLNSELFTLPSIGMRLHFIRGRNRK